MKNKLITVTVAVLLGGSGIVFWMQKNNSKPAVQTQAQNGEIQTSINKQDSVRNIMERSPEENKHLEEVLSMRNASIMSTDLKDLEVPIGLYSMGNDGLYPKSLSELIPQYVARQDLVVRINSGEILYAYSSDMKKYHIGINVDIPGTEGATLFKYDKDFDSKSAGYINGFDGEDPVCDYTSF